jgi:hypothetical protein
MQRRTSTRIRQLSGAISANSFEPRLSVQRAAAKERINDPRFGSLGGDADRTFSCGAQLQNRNSSHRTGHLLPRAGAPYQQAEKVRQPHRAASFFRD